MAHLTATSMSYDTAIVRAQLSNSAGAAVLEEALVEVEAWLPHS